MGGLFYSSVRSIFFLAGFASSSAAAGAGAAAAGLASTGFVTSFSASSMACVHKNAR